MCEPLLPPLTEQATGNTPLHLAARFTHRKIATLLLIHGADISALNKVTLHPYGEKALRSACHSPCAYVSVSLSGGDFSTSLRHVVAVGMRES
jgi:ankyrin repeat protein